MKKKYKILIGVGAPLLALILSGGLWAYFNLLHHYKGKEVINEWHQTDIFDIKSIKTVEKTPGKDFKILNLADVQVADLDGCSVFSKVHDEIDELVETYQPDMITLTGDQTWSNENRLFLKSLIRWLDGYKIPWAPVFGNHDFGNDFNSAVCSREYCCDLYEDGKYSLFSRGPTNIDSLGNYAVNIKENGKIIKTLYMMDLGWNETLTDGQKAWFKWTADGIKANNGGEYSEGMFFAHKDLREHYWAYRNYLNHPETAEGPVYAHGGYAFVDVGDFVETAKSCGVKDFLCGHQHSNNFTINYEGARYTFVTKTTETMFYYEGDDVYLNGATEIIINNEKTSFAHHYVERGKYHL